MSGLGDQLRQIAAAVDALEHAHSVAAVPVLGLGSKPGANETLTFVDKMIGMQHMPDNDATRLSGENLRRHDESLNRYHNGNVAVGTLDRAGKAYLAHMSGPYFDKTGTDLRFAGAVGGTTAEINAAFSEGDAWRNNYPADQYTGPLKAIIKAMMGD